MDGHLVAVEVGVEGCANERMKLDRLAFHQHGLESLNAEPVQRRRPVQQHWMLADHLVEDIPDLRAFLFDELLRLLHSRGVALSVEPRVDEGLEQFERHLLRQAALMQLEFRADHDHGAAGIVTRLPSKFCRKRPCLPFSMSASDFSGRLFAPVMTRPRLPLSNSASTAS